MMNQIPKQGNSKAAVVSWDPGFKKMYNSATAELEDICILWYTNMCCCATDHRTGERIKSMKGLYIWKKSKNEKVGASTENVIKGGKMGMPLVF